MKTSKTNRFEKHVIKKAKASSGSRNKSKKECGGCSRKRSLSKKND